MAPGRFAKDAGIQLTAEILDSSLLYTDAELITIAENRTKRLLTDNKHVGEVASTRGVDTWDLTLFLRAACKVEAIENQEQLQLALSDLRQKNFYEFSDEDEQYLFCSF